MNFVELHRNFLPIEKDQEASIEVGRVWGGRFSGWRTWRDLIHLRRVVLLAEAASGKSEEFRHQTQQLTRDGNVAFCVRIEELADQGLESALGLSEANSFEEWIRGGREGWFFLDSVDEARLNHKSLETALKRFARAVDQSLDRAHIFISCRVTDWRGEADRRTITQLLPAREPPRKEISPDADPLLDPIFAEEKSKQTHVPEPDTPEPLRVVQLLPLLHQQCRILAAACGVHDLEAFIGGIVRQGLDAFTERPGDVIDLATYWKDHGKFNSLSEMTEHSISRKLRELDTHRADSDLVSPDLVREGAQQLAAALTFGKSFALQVPGHDPDPSLSAGAMDPAEILPQWTDAQLSALTRRAVFAPSTYGRIRFHHRSTQEYLAARWLYNLLEENCPRAEAWSLMFADRYGVEVVVPSRSPVAAWLGLWDPDFRSEILRREPLLLIQHGDPRSLPLETKQELLRAYATMHATGQISNDHVDNRALWLFADQRLSNTIREVWEQNGREDFRLDLLRLIREGAIAECRDLARDIALDRGAGTYHRIVAAQALAACKDAKALAKLALCLTDKAATLDSRVAAAFAEALFPAHLTVEQLLSVIAEVPDDSDHVDGFGYRLVYFYQNSPTRSAQLALMGGVAELCMTPPFLHEHKLISAKHEPLTRDLERLARAELDARGTLQPAPELVCLLMAIERADRTATLENDEPIDKIIRSSPELNRALFWADVADRTRRSNGEGPTDLWQMQFEDRQLWGLGEADLSWLKADVRTMLDGSKRKLALQAILVILRGDAHLSNELAELRELVSDEPSLLQTLHAALQPHQATREWIVYQQKTQEHRDRHRAKEAKDKASWQAFRNTLQADPDILRDPKKIKTWKSGAFRLHDLSRWLHRRIRGERTRSAREWRVLVEAFGQSVAEAYRDGMKEIWRLVRADPGRC